MERRTRIPTLLALPVVMLSLLAVPARAAGPFDGAKPFLCAVATVMECDLSGQCERNMEEAAKVTFIRVDVGARKVVTSAGRTSAPKSVTHLNGHLILQGSEDGRGWSATIEEASGRMAAAVVDNDHTFSLFGACTLP
jgi:hypothetical protein